MKRLLIVLPLFLIILLPYACFGQAADTGNALGNQAIAKYGSEKGMNENMFKPMMSGSTPMTTLDNTQSFSSPMLCPSSQALVTVFVQPGPTGDLTTVYIGQDLDFNGTVDYTYSIPLPVSGICANGVISCGPGTWQNCRAFRWTADPANSQVYLEETMNTNIGGCYCINSSCGSNLATTNMELVLKTIGGGATSAVRSINTRYVVSGMTIAGPIATYYGQNARDCLVSGATVSNYEQYFYDPSGMQGAAENEIAAQSLSPNSLYSVMNGILTNESASIIPCTVVRSSQMGWDALGNCEVRDTIINGCSTIETDAGCSLREEIVDGVTTVHNSMYTGLSPEQSCNTLTNTAEASCDYGCTSDPTRPCLLNPAGGMPICTLADNTTESCGLMVPIIGGGGSGSQTSGAWGAGNILHVGAGATVVFNPDIQVWGSSGINLGNACYVYGSGNAPGVDPSGNPYDSYLSFYTNPWWVYEGRVYIKGAVVTGSSWFFTTAYSGAVGISIPPSHYSWSFYTGGGGFNVSYMHCPLPGASACIGGPAYCHKTCSDIACRDWWRKERTYACTHTSYDFSNIKRRADSIKQSVTDNTNSVYYRDYRQQNDGTWVMEDNTVNTAGQYRPAASSCTEACKTVSPKEGTDTTLIDVRTNFLTNPSMYNVNYKTCTATGCPVATGETIVKDCQCIQEFMEAALIMQIIRSAGRDFICSSGTKRPMTPR